MLHMEFNPNLINWVETSPKQSLTLPVTLQLHDHTYVRLNVQRSMTHPRCKPQAGQATASPEVITHAIADTGAQMDILSLGALQSLEFDPSTNIKVQVRVLSAVRG